MLLLSLIAVGCGGDGVTEPNQPPSASISQPQNGAGFTEGDAVTFQGSANDPEDGTLTGAALVWESDVDGQIGTGGSATTSTLSVDSHTISLTATDRDGAAREATISITVEPNQPPSAAISSPMEGDSFIAGNPIAFEGSADDPEDGALTATALIWESDVDGQIGIGGSVTTGALSVGDHAITLTATDSHGATGQASVSISVEPNQPPSASISAPADGSTFNEGDAITFQGSGDDPEDGSLTGTALVWESDVDGEFGTGESVVTTGLSSGIHNITLTATDGVGATAQEGLSITVEGPPAVSISSPGDQSIFDEGEIVAFEGSANDAVEGPLEGSSLEWSSDVDGALGTGETVSVSSLSAGPHVIVLTATDSDGSTATASIDLLVESPGFDVRIRFLDSFTPGERATIEAGIAPWETVVAGDLQGGFLPPDVASVCGTGEGGIDDLLVVVLVRDIDGSGGTLAQAGPCAVRVTTGGDFSTVISGVVTIDQADRDHPDLEQIVTHEVGHVLGIGVAALDGWGFNTGGSGTQDPFFAGSSTLAAFTNDLDGEAYLGTAVPLENTGGAGTAGGHWREVNFDDELMTGFINAGVDMPLSSVTVSALADIGYVVDLSAADAFSLPMPQRALWLAEADATLSRPTSSTVNFGLPDGSAPSIALIAGSNNANFWSADPEDEVYSGLLRFELPPSPPAGVTVETVALHLTVADRDSETTGHDIEVVPITSTWSEGSVTWDTRPSDSGSAVLAFDFNSCTSCQLPSVAFRDLAIGWLDGSTANHGVLIRAPDADSDPTFSVGYWTRHVTAPSFRPTIAVDARTGTPLRTPSISATGDRIPLGDDIRTGPLYGVNSAGSIVRIEQIR